VGCIFGIGRIAEDRSSQPVGSIEMLIGQPAERGRSVDLLSRPCSLGDGHVDGLRRGAHDDMTIEQVETFTGRGHAAQCCLRLSRIKFNVRT
jgi:hypothetical protein